jgi:hypothetical protein
MIIKIKNKAIIRKLLFEKFSRRGRGGAKHAEEEFKGKEIKNLNSSLRSPRLCASA